MTYLAVFLLLNLLVLIHEAGHLAVARAAGIPVAEFAVGFGPRLVSRRWRGVEYSLRAVPLGGFVLPAAAGEDDFRAIPLARRLAFFLGGPLANLAAALPLLAWRHAAAHGLSLAGLFVAPFVDLGRIVAATLAAVPLAFSRPDALQGVVGIVADGGRLAAQGHALDLAAFLSVSLAILNLLPIPVLDGGQIVLSTLEERFPAARRLRLAATVAGLALLAGLLLYTNARDVVRLWG